MDDVESRIHSTFVNIASSLGYSEVNGRIISALLAENKPLSLQDLANKTGYSLSSVSIALDLLEIIGVVKKTKEFGDRRVFVRLDGDLLEGLRNALLLKLQKEIAATLEEFSKYKDTGNERTQNMVTRLEKEVLRLEEYVKKLSEVEVPKN